MFPGEALSKPNEGQKDQLSILIGRQATFNKAHYLRDPNITEKITTGVAKNVWYMQEDKKSGISSHWRVSIAEEGNTYTYEVCLKDVTFELQDPVSQ